MVEKKTKNTADCDIHRQVPNIGATQNLPDASWRYINLSINNSVSSKDVHQCLKWCINFPKCRFIFTIYAHQIFLIPNRALSTKDNVFTALPFTYCYAIIRDNGSCFIQLYSNKLRMTNRERCNWATSRVNSKSEKDTPSQVHLTHLTWQRYDDTHWQLTKSPFKIFAKCSVTLPLELFISCMHW